jgi:predicted NBD/HSP70 family sugar kinase
MAITGDQSFLKHINRMALIRLIRGRPGWSRADLAECTGLTKSTVSQLVQELIDEGWLAEDDALVTGSIGRRPTPLRLDDKRLAMIGVDLTLGSVQVVATALTGEVVASSEQKLASSAVADVIGAVAQRAAEVIAEVSRVQGRRVLGLGIGVPGPVHEGSGVLHHAANLDWHNVPVRSLLQQALGELGWPQLPVFLQRRAASAALGEVEFATTTVEEPLLFIHLGKTIGAGVFVGGRLLSGHGGFAGDVGHLQLVPDGPQCICGRRGCADTLTSLAAMSARLGVSDEEFVARVQAGDEAACAAAREGGAYLASLIHQLWLTFDPAQIVLGGIASRLGRDYVGLALQVLQERTANSRLQPPPVSVARFGTRAVAIGATALVFNQLVRPV